MVQSDLPKGRTKSGKINPKWYLERLKSTSFPNNQLKRRQSNSTIRVVRGTTATQGQFIPRVFLKSPEKQFQDDFYQQVRNFFLSFHLNEDFI